MQKKNFLKPVNSIMAIDFICLVLTALLHEVIPYDLYSILHPVLGYIFVVLVIFHVFLNWSWIKANLFKK
ncbi:MAG: hypothetical protein LKF96_10225 [Treponema sp.]|jgi:predicted ferric reductase|nr:hypothetical protein [Treponema sp.]